MKTLSEKAKWLFFWKMSGGVGTIFLFYIVFVVSSFIDDKLRENIIFIIFIFTSLLILGITISFIFAWLLYRSYKYQLSEYAFKMEKGVINKKYISIPYDKIQNVDIHRSLVARFLGLSDLQIQTAGYGATGGLGLGGSEGRLPGLDMKVAEEMREEIMKKVKDLN